MKVLVILMLVVVSLVDCTHTFLGTSVRRPLVYHHDATFNAKVFSKRIEYLSFTLPTLPNYQQRSIQGILAYDKKNGGATANVTEGGLFSNFVKLRMKSDRGKSMNFDIYIYA